MQNLINLLPENAKVTVDYSSVFVYWLFASDLIELLLANGYVYEQENMFYSNGHVPTTAYIYVAPNGNKVEFYNRMGGLYVYVNTIARSYIY